VGGYLYGTNSQGLMCVDFKKGDIKWKDRSIGPSSVLFADGDLYLHGENGKVALVEATADGYHKKGEFLPPGGTERTGGGIKAWQYPVIANGRLYIRDQNFLWCFDIHQ
jgi:outer membrane protein assembly factor BamB